MKLSTKLTEATYNVVFNIACWVGYITQAIIDGYEQGRKLSYWP